MTLRQAHGARRSNLLVVETLPADEQPQAQRVGPDPLVLGRDQKTKRVLTSEAARALAKLPRRRKLLPRSVACDPAFERFYRDSITWLKGRIAEHHASHGGVSRGVGAMLNQARWLWAGAEFASERAAQQGDVAGFREAAALSSHARQLELERFSFRWITFLGSRSGETSPCSRAA